MTPRMIALRFATSRQQDENWRENKCQPAQGVQPGESGGENTLALSTYLVVNVLTKLTSHNANLVELSQLSSLAERSSEFHH
jgi:hypothetical protein